MFPHSSFKAVALAAGAWCWQTSHLGAAEVWKQAGCLIWEATLCSPGQCIVFPDLREFEQEELGSARQSKPLSHQRARENSSLPRDVCVEHFPSVLQVYLGACGSQAYPGVLSLLGVTL